VYCPGLAERCLEVGEVSGCYVQYYIWLAVSWVYHRLVPMQDFSLLYSVQTSSGPHPASYSLGTGDFFPGGKVAGVRSWRLTSIKCWSQEWHSYTSASAYIFMTWCIIKHSDKFTFYLYHSSLNIKITISRYVTACGLVSRYHNLRGTCYLSFQVRRWIYLEQSTNLHGTMFQRTTVCTVTTLRTSGFAQQNYILMILLV
jgi:hypothetical protein